jgi:hypothetical protein
MADITMCSGSGCPVKDKCYRHTAPVNEYRQAYFMNPPIKEDDSCKYFWALDSDEKL